MKALSILLAVIVAVLLDGSLACAQGSMDDRNVVTIALLPEVAIDDTVVYLDQIARLSGGPIALRQRMARLDVAEFRLAADRTVVPSDQVKFRLMLAGIGTSQFQLSGAKRTTIMGIDEPITARKILAVAEQSIRSKNSSVGAPREFIAPLLDLHASDRVQLEARTPAGSPRNGIARVDVVISVNGKLREIVPVSFESGAQAHPVKGSPIDLEPLAATRLDAPKLKTAPLIKSRDLVRIVVVVGSAQISATGEAQQDGQLGEIIRVRNLESNRVVNGRVESRDIVIAD